MTAAAGVYNADIGIPVRFGGSLSTPARRSRASPTAALSSTSPSVFDGSIGLAVTIPVGQLGAEADIGPLARETSGWEFGDVTTGAQLGWQHGDLSHLGKTGNRASLP